MVCTSVSGIQDIHDIDNATYSARLSDGYEGIATMHKSERWRLDFRGNKVIPGKYLIKILNNRIGSVCSHKTCLEYQRFVQPKARGATAAQLSHGSQRGMWQIVSTATDCCSLTKISCIRSLYGARLVVRLHRWDCLKHASSWQRTRMETL